MLRELLRAGIASTSCIASKWYWFPWNVSEHGVCLHQPHGQMQGLVGWRGGTTFLILSAYICLHLPVACILPFGGSLAPLGLRLGQSFPAGLDYIR